MVRRPANDPLVVARQGRRAGIVSRAIADVLDLLVVVGLALVLVVVAAVVRALFTGEVRLELPGLGARLSLFLILLVAYLTYGWGLNGRTAGKLIMGLRVVSSTGGDISFRRGFARALACVVIPIAFLWALVSRRNASLHDLVLRTAVVYDWGFEVQGPP